MRDQTLFIRWSLRERQTRTLHSINEFSLHICEHGNVYLEFDKSIHNHEYSIECKISSFPDKGQDSGRLEASN